MLIVIILPLRVGTMNRIRRALQSAILLGLIIPSGFAMAEETNKIAITCTEQSGYHIFVEQRVCPIGREKFDAFTLGTHSTFGAYLDLTEVSYLVFPIAVPVCPSNGFVDYKSEYSDLELVSFGATIQRPEYTAQLGKHTSWHLLAELIERSGLGKNEDTALWWIRSRAAAEAVACDTGHFADYAKLALIEIERELSESSTEDSAYWPMQLLAANYERRLNDLSGARERLQRLPEISAEWALAFETLEQAIELCRTDSVEIGEFRKQSGSD